MLKLSLNQAEALDNLIDDREGCLALLTQVDQIVIAMELAATKNPIMPGNETNFIYAKLKAEGARKVYNEIKTILLNRKLVDKLTQKE